MNELEQLIAEQQADNTDVIKPEFPGKQVPLTDSLSNCIGMGENGEIVTNFPRPPRGTLLVGTAPWHGTRGGYTNHDCRCSPCKEANAAYKRERRRNGDS